MSRFLHYAFLSAGLLWVASALAETDAMYALNLVRQNGCDGAQGTGPLFVHRAELDAAARALSQGASLADATTESGYLAKTSHSIHLRNTVGRARIASVLSRKYCDVMSNPDLEDAGTFTDATETWIVLAERLISAAASEPDTATETLLGLINTARAEGRYCGQQYFGPARPLRRVEGLDAAARRQANDMAAAGALSHTGADGSGPGERVTQSGYRWTQVAENVAADQTDPATVVATWIASPGHCSALMDPAFSDTGLALASGEAQGSGIYWVQVFAAPR